jgi:hypothetical protein
MYKRHLESTNTQKWTFSAEAGLYLSSVLNVLLFLSRTKVSLMLLRPQRVSDAVPLKMKTLPFLVEFHSNLRVPSIGKLLWQDACLGT